VRALFDVNVLVALFDEDHIHHARAQRWWSAHNKDGWATCPITQNGFIRVISQAAYPNSVSVTFAHDLLARQVAGTDHVFWPDDVSLLDEQLFDRSRVLGHKQLTDVYLLGLAVKNGGRLVTFDHAVPIGAVRAAGALPAVLRFVAHVP
jgi:toxin-antitoxin system PIN domain toxin